MKNSRTPRPLPSPVRKGASAKMIHVPPSGSHTLRPFVLINMAMTADGKIANANRSISSFGSKRDLNHLYELRATADAVMNGARTIEANNVTMGTGGRRFRELRRRRGLSKYNLRIIVSGSGSVNPTAAIFRRRFSPIIVLTTQRVTRAKLRVLRTLAEEVWICGRNEIDFDSAFQRLRNDWNVRRLVCEGGARLNAALIRADLVDEIHVTICPLVFGGRSAPTIAESVVESSLASAKQFRIHSLSRVGDELFVLLRKMRKKRETK